MTEEDSYNPENRIGRRSTDGVCQFHEDFESLKPVVNRMSGAQKIFLWGAGIFVSVITVITLSAFGVIWDQQAENRQLLTRQYEDNRQLLVNVDKTFSSYIASHNQVSKDGFRRIEMSEERDIAQNETIIRHEKLLNRHEEKIDDLDMRIEKLER